MATIQTEGINRPEIAWSTILAAMPSLSGLIALRAAAVYLVVCLAVAIVKGQMQADDTSALLVNGTKFFGMLTFLLTARGVVGEALGAWFRHLFGDEPRRRNRVAEKRYLVDYYSWLSSVNSPLPRWRGWSR